MVWLFSNEKLEIIEANAFFKLKSLALLNLRNNALKMIKFCLPELIEPNFGTVMDNTLHCLSSLENINLIENPIKEMDAKSFSSFYSLFEFTLVENRKVLISLIDFNWK